ncbi:hypothetical protein DD570_20750 [Klebsiella pneumoniae]|nr:hypothetical protein DD570_20750 [Klebsiella pneumoniae]
MNDRHSETIRHDEKGSVMLKRYRVKMINHECRVIILNFKDFNHRLNSICAGCRQVYKMKGYFSLPAAIKHTAAEIFSHQ